MTVSHRNFSHVQTPDVIDTDYERCNFTQAVAHTRIFPGDDTSRTFTRCNMKNCDLPPGSTRIMCSNRQWIHDVANDVVVTIGGVETIIKTFKVEGT